MCLSDLTGLNEMNQSILVKELYPDQLNFFASGICLVAAVVQYQIFL